MPLPKPNKGEKRQDFIGRCMSDDKSKEEFGEPKQRVAYCLSQVKAVTMAEKVHDELLKSNAEYDDFWNEWTYDQDIEDVYNEYNRMIAKEKKKVKLNKPFRTPDGPKKFSVYVKNDKGNVVKVNFGDPNMEIRRDDDERRKSFRARHQCDTNPGPKYKARYWSCKFWEKNSPVTKLTSEEDSKKKTIDLNDIVYDSALKEDYSKDKVSNLVTVDWTKIINDPPDNDSVQTREELKLISKRSTSRTATEVKEILLNDEDPLNIFMPFLTENKLKFDKKEFKLYEKIVDHVFGLLKRMHNRPRPAQLAEHVGLEIDVLETKTHHTPAYPSGHAAYGYLLAEFLADKYPQHKKELVKLGDKTGFLRVIQGVHYPSDSLASNQLAKVLYKNIKSNLHSKSADKRIPEKDKRGKTRPKDKHSDLYTDEDPKGTINGLGFKDKESALKSIKIIKNIKRKHAHKVQAMLVMIQRLKVAIERTKDKEKLKNLREALKVYEPAFEKLKQKKL
tara:strand:- start:7694 stop:9205 length:1512 start_codon:yes stop_codon:yes gene_type:complete